MRKNIPILVCIISLLCIADTGTGFTSGENIPGENIEYLSSGENNPWIPESVHSVSSFSVWLYYNETIRLMQAISEMTTSEGIIIFADSCFQDISNQSHKWIVCSNSVDASSSDVSHKAILQVYDSDYMNLSIVTPFTARLDQQFELDEYDVYKVGWLDLDDNYYLYCIGEQSRGNISDIAVFTFDSDDKLRIVAEATLWATYMWEIEGDGVVEINPFSIDEGFNNFYMVDLDNLLTHDEIIALDKLEDYERIISYKLKFSNCWEQYLITMHDDLSGYETNIDGSSYPVRFSGAEMWNEISLDNEIEYNGNI